MIRAERADPLFAQNPWPGLRAYEESESEYFKGRDGEVGELADLISHSAVVVIGGQSGVGKSSLIRAGLFPKLKSGDYLPFHVRLCLPEKENPRALASQILDRLTQTLDAGIGTAGGSAAPAPGAPIAGPRPSSSDTLWEYFHRADLHLWGPRNRLLTPVIVLDQFEEVVRAGKESLAGAARVDAFAAELEALLEHRPPEAIRRALDANPERAAQYDFRRQSLKLIISLRKEYLADLDAWSVRVPALIQNRFLLQRMSGLQALEAVRVPGRDIVEEKTAAEIVEFVSKSQRDHRPDLPAEKRSVEPALLSVVCTQLNLRRRARDPVPPKITAELLAGEREDIIHHFYNEAFDDLNPQTRRWVEDELLTSTGHRRRGAREDAVKADVPNSDLAALIDRHVLQDDVVNNVSWLELTHDLLTDPATRSRALREAEEARRRAEREAEAAKRQAEREARSRRWFRALSFALVAVSLVGFYVAWWAHRSAEQALAEKAKLQDTVKNIEGSLSDNLSQHLYRQETMGVDDETSLVMALSEIVGNIVQGDDHGANISRAKIARQNGLVALARANGHPSTAGEGARSSPLDDFETAYRLLSGRNGADRNSPDEQRLLADVCDRVAAELMAEKFDYRAARRYFAQAKGIRERELKAASTQQARGDWEAELSQSYDNLGTVELQTNQRDQAAQDIDTAKKLSSELLTPAAPDDWVHAYAESMVSEAALAAVGRDSHGPDYDAEWRDDIEAERRMLPLTEASRNAGNGQWQYDFITLLGNMGGMCEQLGALGLLAPGAAEPSEAIPTGRSLQSADRASLQANETAIYYYEWSQRLRERLADLDPNNATWRAKLAIGYDHLGDIAKAEGWLRGSSNSAPSALGYYEQSYGIRQELALNRGDTAALTAWATSRANLAATCWLLGDLPAARDDCAEAILVLSAVQDRNGAGDGRSQNQTLATLIGSQYCLLGNVLSAQGIYTAGAVPGGPGRASADAMQRILALPAERTDATAWNLLHVGSASEAYDRAVAALLSLSANGGSAPASGLDHLPAALRLALAHTYNCEGKSWVTDFRDTHAPDAWEKAKAAYGSAHLCLSANPNTKRLLADAERLSRPDWTGMRSALVLSFAELSECAMTFDADGDLALNGVDLNDEALDAPAGSASLPTAVLDRAAHAYRNCIEVEIWLAQLEPKNVEWTHNLAENEDRLGQVLMRRGDAAAEDKQTAYYVQADKTLADAHDRLRQLLQGPCAENLDWEVDLATVNDHLGDVARASGKLDTALSSHLGCLRRESDLVYRDQGAHAVWRLNLRQAFSHCADILRQMADEAKRRPDEAAAWLKAVESAESDFRRLAPSDEVAVGVANDVGMARQTTFALVRAIEAHGLALEENGGDLSIARQEHEDALRAIQGLPASSGSADVLPISAELHERLGEIVTLAGKSGGGGNGLELALADYEQARSIREAWLRQQAEADPKGLAALARCYDEIGGILGLQAETSLVSEPRPTAGAEATAQPAYWYARARHMEETLICDDIPAPADDPEKDEWHRDLAVTIERLAGTETLALDWDAAWQDLFQAEALLRPVAEHAGNLQGGWVRDYAILHAAMGDFWRRRGLLRANSADTADAATPGYRRSTSVDPAHPRMVETAMYHYQRSEQILLQLLAREPGNALTLKELANVYEKMGYALGAEARIADSTKGDELSGALGLPIGSLSAANPETALAAFARAYAIRKRFGEQGSNGWQVALVSSFAELANTMYLEGNLSRAIEFWNQALAVSGSPTKPADASWLAACCREAEGLGDALFATGRPEPAFAQYDAAIQVLQSSGQEGALSQEATLLLAQLLHNEARAYEDQAQFHRLAENLGDERRDLTEMERCYGEEVKCIDAFADRLVEALKTRHPEWDDETRFLALPSEVIQAVAHTDDAEGQVYAAPPLAPGDAEHAAGLYQSYIDNEDALRRLQPAVALWSYEASDGHDNYGLMLMEEADQPSVNAQRRVELQKAAIDHFNQAKNLISDLPDSVATNRVWMVRWALILQHLADAERTQGMLGQSLSDYCDSLQVGLGVLSWEDIHTKDQPNAALLPALQAIRVAAIDTLAQMARDAPGHRPELASWQEAVRNAAKVFHDWGLGPSENAAKDTLGTLDRVSRGILPETSLPGNHSGGNG